MIRKLVERSLSKIFATEAREPDPERMTAAERRHAEAAMQPSGEGLQDDLADDSDAATRQAEAASQEEPPARTDPVDNSEMARALGRSANEPHGGYLETDLVDDSETAEAEAVLSNPNEPPRDDLAADTETAREDARRANRPPE